MAAFSSFQLDSIFLPNSPVNKMCGSLEEITNTPCFQFYEPENLQKLSTLLSDNEASFSHGTNKQNVSMDSSSITDTTPTSCMGKKKRKTKVASSSNFAQSKDTGAVKGKKAKKCKDDEEKKTTRKEKEIDEKKGDQEEAPTGYIHVRARRGQATDSHSLAERVRRERISERMKLLQALVPGCDKVTGKALMLDEIINYVQSLQNQVEFLSMKLASTTPMCYNFGVDLESFMDRPDQNLRSLASAAQAYPLVDNSSSPQLGQMPNSFSQGNGQVWWGVDEQRQKPLNQAGISYNLCS